VPECVVFVSVLLPEQNMYATQQRKMRNHATKSNSSLCSASTTRLSTWHCPHLLLSAVLRPTAVAPLLLVAPGVGRRRLISAARTALGSKPAARHCCGRMVGQTDIGTPFRYKNPLPLILRGQRQSINGNSNSVDSVENWERRCTRDENNTDTYDCILAIEVMMLDFFDILI